MDMKFTITLDMLHALCRQLEQATGGQCWADRVLVSPEHFYIELTSKGTDGRYTRQRFYEAAEVAAFIGGLTK